MGFIFGIVQMVLYAFFKNGKKTAEEPKLHVPEHIIDAVKLSPIVCAEVLNPVVSLLNSDKNEAIGDPTEKELKAQETRKGMNESIEV